MTHQQWSNWPLSCDITSDCASRRGGDKMATIWKSANLSNKTNQSNNRTNNTLSGTILSSWSRQQKLAMIAGFAILGLLLVVSACSNQASKPALVSVPGPVSTSLVAPAFATTPAAATAAPVSPATKKTPKKRPANVTYDDANSGVSFLYPRKFALTSGGKAQSERAGIGEMSMNFVRPGGVAVATVAVPSGSYPGTDFASAYFNVNINRSLSEQECSHFAFVDTRDADGKPIDAERVKIGSTDMEMTSDFSAGALKQVETQYYHRYANGACYEYVLGLGTEGFGAKAGITHIDRDEVFAKMEKILATATVKAGPVEEEPVAEQTAAAISGKE
jgi:hypothetical protein